MLELHWPLGRAEPGFDSLVLKVWSLTWSDDPNSHFCTPVKPGVLFSITKAFAKTKISIKNLIQNPDKKNKKAFITVITHENFEKNYENLLIDLKQNKFLLKKPIFIRIVKV